MRGMKVARVDAVDLGADLEPARLVARVERARIAIVAGTVRDEAARARRLSLLRICRERVVHPVVLAAGAELEAMRDALGHDEEVACAIFDRSERRLQRAAAVVDEVD